MGTCMRSETSFSHSLYGSGIISGSRGSIACSLLTIGCGSGQSATDTTDRTGVQSSTWHFTSASPRRRCKSLKSVGLPWLFSSSVNSGIASFAFTALAAARASTTPGLQRHHSERPPAIASEATVRPSDSCRLHTVRQSLSPHTTSCASGYFSRKASATGAKQPRLEATATL